MIDSVSNSTMALNEIAILVLCDIFYVFTDYVTQAEIRNAFGWIFIYITYGLVLFDSMLLFVDIGRFIILRLKRFYALRKQRIQRA